MFVWASVDRLQQEHAMDVYRRLKDEVESAWQRFDTAANAFQKILKTPDILPPYPDGIQLIRNVNRDYRVAGEEFMKAQRRMVEFTTRGVVPEDLKD